MFQIEGCEALEQLNAEIKEILNNKTLFDGDRNMIGERTKTLFKVWGTGAASRPKTMRTMESYCSHASGLFPNGFDITYNSGTVKTVDELRNQFTIIGAMIGNLSGDVGAAIRAVRDFVQWLINEGKSGIQYAELLDELRAVSHYIFQESYREFFRAFTINEDALINYAMRPDVSYFASSDSAMASWNDLTGRLLGGQTVVIRNDSELFRLFYEQVFRNVNVVKDRDGNTAPIQALAAVTGVTTRAQDSNARLLVDYKLSHIYARPNNPLMFSGVYNFAFTPTLVDALTEDAQCEFAIRFRHVFREFAHRRYGEIYELFRQFVIDHDIERQIDMFNPHGYSSSRIAKFRQMAHADWSPIFEIPD